MPDMSALDDILMEIAHTDYQSPRRSLLEGCNGSAEITPDCRMDHLNSYRLDFQQLNRTFPRRVTKSFDVKAIAPPDFSSENVDDAANGNLAVPCPFGTYLDLHFVEFCNNLSWSKRVPESIKRFRQTASKRKKKWRKSMDQMLYVDFNPVNQAKTMSEVDSVADSKSLSESTGSEPSPLNEALDHFDEALKNHFSGRKQTKLEVCREEEEAERFVYSLSEKQQLRESLFMVPDPRLPKKSPEVFKWPESHQNGNLKRDKDLIEGEIERAESTSSSSPSSITNRMVPAEALESIREKLAAGLVHMKHLQDQVDTIPVLQNQISNLQKEIFLRDEQDSNSIPPESSTSSDAEAVAFIQLYAPELLEKYIKWIGKSDFEHLLIKSEIQNGNTTTEERKVFCDKESQVHDFKETVDVGIATSKQEVVSFGINTEPAISVELPESHHEEKTIAQRTKPKKPRKANHKLFNRRKQQIRKNQSEAINGRAASHETEEIAVREEELEEFVLMESVPKSAEEEITDQQEFIPPPTQSSNSFSESIPESGIAPSLQSSEEPVQSYNAGSISPSHSGDANSCSSDDVDEGSYDLQHGHLSDKCFDENQEPTKHVYTNYICRQTLNKEMLAACKVFNDSVQRDGIYKAKRSPKNASSLAIIHREWFPTSSSDTMDAQLVSDYLDVFEETSSLLLRSIVNMTDENGNTLLHYALSRNNFDVVSLLLDSKVCDVDIVNRAGYTSVMLASLGELTSTSHYAIAVRLFGLGDINRKAQQHGQTALMLAVSHGRLDTVRMLLEVGADVNIQDSDGSTALMCASEHGHTEIVKMLLEHPDIDTSLIDQDGMAALYVALEAGNKEIAALIYTRTSSTTKLNAMSASMSEKVSNGENRRPSGKNKIKTATM